VALTHDSLLDAIDRLRSAVASDDADLEHALDAPPFAHGEIARDTTGSVSHATVDLANAVPLTELESRYGDAHRSPAGPKSGRPRRVQFDATLPQDGSVGATVLAELDGSGNVVRVLIRRDAF